MLLSLQPDAAAQRGALQLYDSMQAQFSAQGGLGGAAASPAVVALPPGFLEELAAAQDAEGLGAIMGPVGEWPAACAVWLQQALSVRECCAVKELVVMTQQQAGRT